MKRNTTRLFIDVRSGEKFWARTVKELRSKIGNGGSRVNKMYVDAKDGHTYHVGYVIGGYWLEMYELVRNAYEPVRREVKV